MGNSNSHTRPQSQSQYDHPPPSYADSHSKPILDYPLKGGNSLEKTDHDPKSKSDSVPNSPTQSRPSRFNIRGNKRRDSIPEDALEMLSRYDVWIVVDDSGSMGDNASQRWFEARDALAPLAETAGRYDADGLDLFFLNSRKMGKGLKVGLQVESLISIETNTKHCVECCLCPTNFCERIANWCNAFGSSA